jgi:hypothetical protein
MLLGIDTGGTYTDAVLYDEATRTVVAKAKSPTTHHELSIGICGAIDAVLAAASIAPERIELVSLSTTLATNALVEGKGRRVGAVIIGFDGDVLERAGLGDALGDDPAVILAGGHDPHGGRGRRQAVGPHGQRRGAPEPSAGFACHSLEFGRPKHVFKPTASDFAIGRPWPSEPVDSHAGPCA